MEEGTVAKVDLPNLKSINEWSPTLRVRKVRGSSSISSQKLVLSSFCAYVVLFGVRVTFQLCFEKPDGILGRSSMRSLRDPVFYELCPVLMIAFYRRRRSMVAFGGGSRPAGWCSEQSSRGMGVDVAGRLRLG